MGNFFGSDFFLDRAADKGYFDHPAVNIVETVTAINDKPVWL